MPVQECQSVVHFIVDVDHPGLVPANFHQVKFLIYLAAFDISLK